MPKHLPVRGLLREGVLTLGGVGILVIVAFRGQLDPATGVAIALALLGVGPVATAAESVVHNAKEEETKDETK